MERKAFLDQEPPPGYVAGIGRGATGFTTSADSGPVRFPGSLDEADEDADENEDAANFEDDEENGILGSKDKDGKDNDDDEADRIYAQIDDKMKSRNKSKSEDNFQVEVQDNSSRIKEQFSNLKRALTSVKDDEWANIPEVGDITRRNKRTRLLEQQQQRFYSMPDSMLAGSSSLGTAGSGSLGTRSSDEITNFQSISHAKELLLSKQLDNIASTDSSSTEDISKELEQLHEAENKIQDVKKGRLILASLRKTEPHKANSWIASARLEEQAKNLGVAKKLIIEGCHKAPRHEDIWLENIRLHQKTSEGTKICKSIANEGLRYNSKSQKLWLKAFELEDEADTVSRRRILMKGLEFIPTNVMLWKALINLEDSQADVKKFLSKAVELCPKEWDFWLALINLSTYDESKSLLAQARKVLSDNYMVWITACKLQEREKSDIPQEMLDKLMAKGFKELEKNTKDESKLLTKQDWFDQAVNANKEGFSKTCKAIVVNVLEFKEDTSSSLEPLFDDAESLISQGHDQVANEIYSYIIQKDPTNIDSWLSLLSTLKKNKDHSTTKLFEYYEKAVTINSKNELLPLMYAKDTWIIGSDTEAARNILADACTRLPKSENIWLARVKLEVKNFNYSAAESISNESISIIPNSSPRVWYKHIHLLRFLMRRNIIKSNLSELVSLSDQALDSFSQSPHLYLQKSQILLDLNEPKGARECISVGTKKCDDSINLWLVLSWIDENSLNSVIRARSVLDTAILQDPTCDKLWEAKIELEKRQSDKVAAEQLSNKALKIFPASPLLWIQHLSLIPKMSQRKNAFLDALKATNNSPQILLSIGVFFWLDGKFLKAKSWFERALTSDKSNGDSWGWLYSFISKHGTDEERTSLLKTFEAGYEEINKGQVWNPINKDVDNFDKSPAQILGLVSQTLLAKRSW